MHILPLTLMRAIHQHTNVVMGKKNFVWSWRVWRVLRFTTWRHHESSNRTSWMEELWNKRWNRWLYFKISPCFSVASDKSYWPKDKDWINQYWLWKEMKRRSPPRGCGYPAWQRCPSWSRWWWRFWWRRSACRRAASAAGHGRNAAARGWLASDWSYSSSLMTHTNVTPSHR